MKFSTIRSSLALAATVMLLSGCRDEVVVFEPGCIAFAGDRITITGDRYVWERYTDARRVDNEGNEIDPFPDYPQSGSVKRDGKRVVFAGEAGNKTVTMHIVEQYGIRYMLRDEQYKAVEAGGAVAECALRQRSESAKSES